MAQSSREHILSEIRRLAKENGGTPLGRERFEAVTGILESSWSGRYWARWNDAVSEAGYEPNSWQSKTHDDDTLIRLLADMTRELGRFPTTPELQLARRASTSQIPSDKVFSNRLGTKADQIEKVRAFARSQASYADVATILAFTARAPRRKPDTAAQVVTGAVYLIRMGEFHKIGKSNDPGRRDYELTLQLPEKHDVVHVIGTDDPSGIEAYWHRRFSSQRANGEWFRLAPGAPCRV